MYKAKLKVFAILTVIAMLVSGLPIAAGAVDITTSYYDYNFDSEADSDNSWTNQSGSSYGLTCLVNSAGATQTLATDTLKGTNVVKVAIPSGDSGNVYRVGTSGKLNGLDTVTWYELSFKYEGVITQTALVTGNNYFNVLPDGSFYVGGLKDVSVYNGIEVTNFTVETDTWYHLVMAVDFVDAVSGAPKLYAWVDGELLTTALSDECTAVWNWNTTLPKNAVDDFWLTMNASSTGGTVYFDNVKLYTTDVKVSEDDFDPTDIFDGAVITSDELFVDETNSLIYAPAGETLGGVSALITTSDNGVGFYKNGAAIEEEDTVVTSAVGCSVFARSDSGIGLKEYQIVEGQRKFDYDASTVRLKVKNGEEFDLITDISDISDGDDIILSLNMDNAKNGTQNCILVFAAYKGTALAGCSIKSIEVAQGQDIPVTSELLNIEDAEGVSLKAFIWKSEDDKTPIMTRIEF